MDIARVIILLLLILTSAIYAQAQKPKKFHLVSFGESWKLDAKVGSAMMLSGVPSKYLDRFNFVNIPVNSPGLNASFSVRKAFTGHLEMGYQVSYISLSGEVNQDSKTYHVNTQALEHNYLLLLNLRRTDYIRPTNNGFIYYKIGAISIKNSPRLRLPDGNLQPDPNLPQQKFFVDNAAVGTGVGIGINHQVTDNLSFTGTFEFSRTSDVASDIFKIQKLFYDSPNTGNRYTTLNFGIEYTFDMASPRRSNFNYKPQYNTQKRMTKSKVKMRKTKWSRKNKSFWH